MRPTTAALLLGVLLGAAACREDRVAGPSAELATTTVTYQHMWPAAGMHHSCVSRAVVQPNWIRLCWGFNHDGQVGNGTFQESVLSPSTVTNTTGSYFYYGDGGWTHTCALSNGRAYCWGRNDYGQLGNGTNTRSAVPVLVAGGITWQWIATGDWHTCGVSNIGVAYCWGRNTTGQLGNNTTISQTKPSPVSTALAFVKLTAGEAFTCGLTTGSDAYCWGNNDRGQLGSGNNATYTIRPGTKVASSLKWSSLVTGSKFACAGTSGGIIYCWGDNSYNQTGHTQPFPGLLYRTPVAVDFGYSFSPIAAGQGHVCGRRSTGIMYCWGRGTEGQLGNGFFVNRPQPYPVYGGYIYQAANLAAGGYHNLAIRSDGSVLAWGMNSSGQLGNGTQNNSGIPIVILPATQ